MILGIYHFEIHYHGLAIALSIIKSRVVNDLTLYTAQNAISQNIYLFFLHIHGGQTN